CRSNHRQKRQFRRDAGTTRGATARIKGSRLAGYSLAERRRASPDGTPADSESACRAKSGSGGERVSTGRPSFRGEARPPSLRPQALKSFSEAQAMHNKFSRTFAALLLIFSLWAGSLTAVAVPQTQTH